MPRLILLSRTMCRMETIMRKGLGHVGRTIEAAFAAEPDNAFTVDDLCDRVYDVVSIEKKHRVAVVRATKALAKQRTNLTWWRSEILGRKLVFYTADNVMSYAMARFKSEDKLYRNNDPRYARGTQRTEADFRAEMQEGGDYHHCVVQGGALWRHVEIWEAERDGNAKKLAKLKAEQDAILPGH
jgi:hypothetical protein